MDPVVARFVLDSIFVYLGVGAVFALLFLTRGLRRVDSEAARSGWPLRLVLLPGCMLFWPRLLGAWWKARQ